MIDEPKHRYVSKSVSDTSDFISTNLLKCEINASDNESLSSNCTSCCNELVREAIKQNRHRENETDNSFKILEKYLQLLP